MMASIDEEATTWVVRQSSGGLDEADQRAFETWYDLGPRHQGAYLRAQAIWLSLDKATVQSNLRPEAPARARAAARPDRRAVLYAGLAATAAAGVTGTVWLSRGGDAQAFTTTMGEVRKVPLSDRTIASLNSDSRVEVRMTPKLRRVILVSGEALFDVAKNPQRPFVVEAGEVFVRAVGTAFSVRRWATGADVLVTEGVVETWNAAGAGHARRISAGERAFVSNRAEPIAVLSTPQEVERRLAWRDGNIVLDNQTLAEAVLEFNRYNRLKIVITDPELQSHRFVGQYRTDQPEQFVDAVHALLGATVSRQGDRIEIGGARSTTMPTARS
ncbi:transmembrane sensor [Caulobacter rhizosphaerae]|uniref:Transmembrane sensor n=1 Tax=Caulobacter rhizosphaerae TaxID=2010972 RepID=A0ABU1MUQ5_9CAUL|nr:FecR domain-containing protein [Caulobacter rhizosphaerae]MDR6529560.1 transmembrane sensor [Caulobacter rhizosphaerae]